MVWVVGVVGVVREVFGWSELIVCRFFNPLPDHLAAGKKDICTQEIESQL